MSTPTPDNHSDAQERPTKGDEPRTLPERSIDSALLDQLLEGLIDEERFVLISHFHADIKISRLAKQLGVEKKRIQRLLSSAVTILMHNCMETMVVTENSTPLNHPDEQKSTEGDEPLTLPERSIDSALLDQLLDGLTDTERFVLISRFHDDISVSQLTQSFEVEKKDIQRWLSSAVRILVCNCMDTMIETNETTPQISPKVTDGGSVDVPSA